MKGKQQDIYSIISSRKSTYKAIILYGPNTFVIEDLYKKLSKALIDEDKEIFGSREFSAKEIVGDADSFYNETQSFGFGVDKKYIRINMHGSEAGGAILEFLKNDQEDVSLIVKAGILSPRSTLRKAAEKTNGVIIVPLYDDDTASLISFIADKTSENNFKISREASNEIISLTGLERGRVSDSINNLMLFLDSSNKREINVDDVRLVLFDTNQNQINELCAHVCLGRIEDSQKVLSRLFLQGITPPQFVAAFLGHFQKIHSTGLRVLSGVPVNAAIKEIKPPIFFKEVKSFQNQIENWGVKKAERALELLVETDLKTKTFSGLGHSIIGDVVLRLAKVAKK